MAPFYGSSSAISRIQSHCQETVYFFTIKLPGVSGTHLINFSHPADLNPGPWIGNPVPWPLDNWEDLSLM